MPDIVKNDTLDYPASDKFIAVIAGQIQRKARFGLGSQYITMTIPSSGTLAWETPETDVDSLYEKIDSEQLAKIGKVDNVLPSESESDLESQENITFQNYLDYIQTSIDESDFDVDMRLVPPPMKQGLIKVKFKFLGKLPPRINFDPEHD
ncbi:MAG: hypothetical protein QQN41_09230 [Nitrosopumilus sp.]